MPEPPPSYSELSFGKRHRLCIKLRNTDVYRLAFVATTIIAALHVHRTARNDTTAPPQMQGV